MILKVGFKKKNSIEKTLGSSKIVVSFGSITLFKMFVVS